MDYNNTTFTSYSIFPQTNELVQHFSVICIEVNKNIMATKELTRLDLRIPRKQKDYFEQVLEIGGFRSLTDFLISAASEKAEAIMEKHNNWLSSENDRKIFFNALLNPPAPNAKLKKAMQKHREFKSKK
jgi:uncharacterized protein (DUF1778 family)